jgi:hypothetical protein
MVELAGFLRALRACIGKIKSVAASRCAEAAAMAAFRESCRDSGHGFSSLFDPVRSWSEKT